MKNLKSGTTLKELLKHYYIWWYFIHIKKEIDNLPNISFDEETQYQIRSTSKIWGYININAR